VPDISEVPPPPPPEQTAPTASGGWRRLRQLATIDVGPLRRHRDFRLLFAGQAVTFFGSMITSVAMPFQVYQITHSSLAVGILGAFEIVPILALAFLGGALADAHDRRRMVLLTELVLACLSAVLVGNAAIPHPHLWVIYAVSMCFTAVDTLQRPSLEAMMPRLVERHELMAAGALSSLRSTIGQIAGPALGGVLVATVGLPETYGIDVLSFLGSLLALKLMRASPPPSDAQPASLRRVLEGIRYARSRQELIGTYVVDMVAMFFGMPMALFPALAARYGGPSVLGLLYSAPAVGSFLVTATSGWTRHVHRHGMGVIVAAATWGIAVIAFGLAPSLPVALVFLTIAGGADMVSGLFRGIIWSQTIPDSLRGRLASIELLSYSSGPTLGNLESGAVATVFNIETSIVSGGILCVIGVALLAAALPAFRRYDGRSHTSKVTGSTN
jgi:MFS family permease